MPEQKHHPKLFTDRFTEPTGGDEHRPFPEAPSCNTEPSENESCRLLEIFKSIFRAVTGEEHQPIHESLVDDVETELFDIAWQEQDNAKAETGEEHSENSPDLLTENGMESWFFREIVWEFFNAWRGYPKPQRGMPYDDCSRGMPFTDSPCVESFIGWYYGFNVDE